MSRNPDLHKNHRSRTLETYLSQESETIPDHILLEMMLYYSIPRRDTNELAHALLEHCGSFNNVLDATEKDLTEVKGIGSNSARLVRLFGLIKRKYDINASLPPKKQFASISEIGEYLVALLKNRKDEVLYMLMLGNQNNLLYTRKLNDGVAGSVEITNKKIIETAISCKCSKIVLAHNHPGGQSEPSDKDVYSTLEIKRACNAVEIDMIEHFIIAGNYYTPILTYISDRHKKQLNI